MEHNTISGMGGTVHYWICRPGRSSKGTIVFTHGLTADHTMFEKQVACFRNTYTLILWDVPLHGRSIPYEGFSYENAAKDLNAILEQEQLDRVSLVGMSMGGYPSQMFAHLYPDKVQCLIGIGTTPFGTAYYSKSDLWWLSKVKPMAELFPDRLLRRSMARSVSAAEDSFQKMLEILKPLSKSQIVRQMDIAYGKFAAENRDLSLTCPVLILLGEKDRTGKVRQYCKAWAEKEDYPLRIIGGAAHFANSDNAAAVNSEIEGFLSLTALTP